MTNTTFMALFDEKIDKRSNEQDLHLYKLSFRSALGKEGVSGRLSTSRKKTIRTKKNAINKNTTQLLFDHLQDWTALRVARDTLCVHSHTRARARAHACSRSVSTVHRITFQRTFRSNINLGDGRPAKSHTGVLSALRARARARARRHAQFFRLPDQK